MSSDRRRRAQVEGFTSPGALDYRRRVRDALILGCGYTGTRVAARLLARGVRVVATARDASTLRALERAGASAIELDASTPASWPALVAAVTPLAPGYRVLVACPPVDLIGERAGATGALLAALPRPARLVYLSSTAVYGDQRDVDATTAVQARAGPQAPRLEAERAVASGPWSWMILRAAAIYGPDRGLHAAAGGPPRRAGHPDAVISRIHVDDLAAVCEAALDAETTGAFPVADRAPASAREVAAFCASIGLTPPLLGEGAGAPPRVGRRVDGRAVLERLGVRLAYPSYRDGIRAAIQAGSVPDHFNR